MSESSNECQICKEYLLKYLQSQEYIGELTHANIFLKFQLKILHKEFAAIEREYISRIKALENGIDQLKKNNSSLESHIRTDIKTAEAERALFNLKWSFQKREQELTTRIKEQHQVVVSCHTTQKSSLQVLRNVCETLCDDLDIIESMESIPNEITMGKVDAVAMENAQQSTTGVSGTATEDLPDIAENEGSARNGHHSEE